MRLSSISTTHPYSPEIIEHFAERGNHSMKTLYVEFDGSYQLIQHEGVPPIKVVLSSFEKQKKASASRRELAEKAAESQGTQSESKKPQRESKSKRIPLRFKP